MVGLVAKCIKNRREFVVGLGWLSGWFSGGFFTLEKENCWQGGQNGQYEPAGTPTATANRVNTNGSLELEVKLLKPLTVTIFPHV